MNARRDETSDERLHALVDGELAPAEAAALLGAMMDDPALRERFARLSLDKQLVRHAYAAEDHAPHAAPAAPSSPPRRAALRRGAAVLVAAGLGWGLRAWQEDTPDGVAPALAGPAHERIVLHIGAAAQATAAVERAEGLLDAARAAGRRLSLEIVANGDGLDLLREDRSLYAARLASLRAQHPGLTLVACGQTVQRVRDGGVAVRLLPGTVTASSALDEIVLRMQQGWNYLRV